MRGVNRNWIGRMGDERGVIAPMTALLMTAVMGMAAFAVDTAMMYSEKAQLQNAADASALAIGQSCAAGLLMPACQKDLANANALAGSNALDGVTEVTKAKVENGTVDVEVQASDPEGKKYFSLVFARALGIETVDIRAKAQAKFDGYAQAHVLPMTFSKCESDPDLVKGIQFFPLHGSALARDPSRVCKTKSSSGAEISGGFGWLVDDNPTGDCTLPVSLATRTYQSDSGINVPMDCNTIWAKFEADLKAGKDFDVLVPIFDNVTGTGKSAVFYIEAFAQIRLQGWQFGPNGKNYLTPQAQAKATSLNLKPTDAGLFGTFVKKISWADAAVLGGPRIYQVGAVRLSN